MKKRLKLFSRRRKPLCWRGDSLWIVKSKRVKGQVLSRLEEIDSAIESCETALRIAERNKFTNEYAMIINNLATSYAFHGRDDKALQYFFKTFELAKQMQDSSLFYTGLHNIGIIYYRLSDYEKALKYLIRAFTISKSINEADYNILKSISLCYVKLNDFTNAELFVKESLKTCQPNCSKNALMSLKFTMGFISLGSENYDKAENEFLISYSLSKEINSIRFQFENIYCLAEIFIKQNRINKAQFYLGEGEKLIKMGAPFNIEMLRMYSKLYEIHSLLGNYKKVAYYQDKYIQLKDSIYNDAFITNLMKIESDYHERQNIGKIAEQNEVLTLKEEIIAKQERLNLFSGILAFILIILVVILGKNIRQKKVMNKILDEKVIGRTQELNEKIHALRMNNEHRNLLAKRAVNEIQSSLATIKGLSFIGLREIQDSKARFYIMEIGTTSHHIAQSLKLISGCEEMALVQKVTCQTTISSRENTDKSTLA